MQPLIEFNQASFSYPIPGREPIRALADVSLGIEEGEFVAIVGANGSGKSTFARLLDALLIPAQGWVRIAGLDTRLTQNHPPIHTLIGMVFQFPEDQFVSTIVEEDVAFGLENLGVAPPEIRRRVEEALRAADLWELRQRPPYLLSAGQMQRLALAGVLAMRPRCIVFDEATTMLDPQGRRAVLAMAHRLHRDGVTIVFITHHMEEAAQAGRVIAFHQGRVAYDGAPAGLFCDAGLLAHTRLDLPPAAHLADRLRRHLPEIPAGVLTATDLLAALPPAEGGWKGSLPAPAPRPPRPAAPPTIHVAGLGHVYLRDTPFAHRALESVALEVGQAEIHALLGATGAGKSTLLQHLNGLLLPQEGTVRAGPFDFAPGRIDRRRVSQEIGLVFQNPDVQFFERYVGDEVAFGPRLIQIDEPLAARVAWAMRAVGLDFAAYKDRELFTLSGGERRKVALASSLALKPSILLLDEPTAGLDPLARRELIVLLKQMQAAGMTLVLSTHQIEDAAALADGLSAFAGGRVALQGPPAEVFMQGARLGELGLEPPLAMQVAAALRELGWPLPDGVTSADELDARLAQVGAT